MEVHKPWTKFVTYKVTQEKQSLCVFYVLLNMAGVTTITKFNSVMSGIGIREILRRYFLKIFVIKWLLFGLK
jgi:hypothetical protein